MQYYTDAVNLSGGDATCEYLPRVDLSFDGLILCGGNDIDPKYYGDTHDIDYPKCPNCNFDYSER